MNTISRSSLSYKVRIYDPVAHLFEVILTVDKPIGDQVLSLPTWIPGSYMIRDFAKNIVEFSASDYQGNSVRFHKNNKTSWQFSGLDNGLIVRYLVYGFDLSVRSAHLDRTHAFFNGTSLFLEVVGQSNQSCDVIIERPNQTDCEDWILETSMNVIKVDGLGFGQYRCTDYQDLIDHPVEMGVLTVETFDVRGISHRLVFLNGDSQIDLNRIAGDLSKICSFQVDFFGTLPKCVDQYIFLVHVLENGYGGLEHRSSTALHCSRKELPNRKTTRINDDYINFLTLSSHEYFHTWLVKQIRPKSLALSDLSTESYTSQLWIFEGITAYYEDRMAFLSGVIDESQYLKLLSQVITRVYRSYGRHRQSVAESSFEAWTKFYQQEQNAPNVIVSYYTKGKLVALCLDLIIRLQSGNSLSLDNVMQYLWNEYGAKLKFLEEKEFESIISSEFGLELDDFFLSTVYSCEELPLESLLNQAGIEIEWGANSKFAELELGAESCEVNWGASIKANALGAEMVSVYNGSNAYLAGLSTGDIVISINREMVTALNLEERISNYSVGEQVDVHYFSRGKLKESLLTLQSAEKHTAKLTKNESIVNSIDWP